MEDSYFYDSDTLDDVITSLKNKLVNDEDSYQNIIQRDMQGIRNNLDSTEIWKQNNVKPIYLDMFDDYLRYYTDVIKKLNAHINYLEEKTKYMSYIEEKYSSGR